MGWGSWLLLVLLLVQLGLVGLFSRRLHALRRELLLEPKHWPSLEVVLCLRGADACLPRLLESLSRQTYPALWRLQVVVDDSGDPAWDLLAPWMDRQDVAWSELHCTALTHRPQQGSLKCAALLQAFAGVDPSTELVVLLDADIRFASHGLQHCARACLQPGVGAVSGNRWFAPSSPSAFGGHWVCGPQTTPRTPASFRADTIASG